MTNTGAMILAGLFGLQSILTLILIGWKCQQVQSMRQMICALNGSLSQVNQDIGALRTVDKQLWELIIEYVKEGRHEIRLLRKDMK